jgi:hypothetical protein
MSVAIEVAIWLQGPQPLQDSTHRAQRYLNVRQHGIMLTQNTPTATTAMIGCANVNCSISVSMSSLTSGLRGGPHMKVLRERRPVRDCAFWPWGQFDQMG